MVVGSPIRRRTFKSRRYSNLANQLGAMDLESNTLAKHSRQSRRMPISASRTCLHKRISFVAGTENGSLEQPSSHSITNSGRQPLLTPKDVMGLRDVAALRSPQKAVIRPKNRPRRARAAARGSGIERGAKYPQKQRSHADLNFGKPKRYKSS